MRLTVKHGLLAAMALAWPLVGSVAAQAEDLLARVKAKGELNVGTEYQFAPFDFVLNGEHAGLNVDLFAEIGKDMGLKINWIDLPWPSVLPGLDAQKFDMVGGPATATKARLERYRFSVPVGDATVAILKKAGNTEITKPADIAGKKVGSAKATAQLAQLQEFAKTLPKPVEIQEYVDFSQSYADLAAGRTEAVANSMANIAYVAQQRPNVFAIVEPPFGAKVYFGYIGRKDEDSKSLMDAIDAAIVKIEQDGRMAELQKKWFGTTMDLPSTLPEPGF